MARRCIGALLAGAIIILLGLSACDVTTPERMIREPLIRGYAPRASAIDAFVGDTVDFSVQAIELDEHPLDIFYTLNDSVSSAGAEWRYTVDDTGTATVRVHVSNGATETSIEWQINRTQPANLPPVIVSFSPVEANPQIQVGLTIEFGLTAVDPEGKTISYAMTVDDSIVTANNRFVLLPTEIGPLEVKGIASDGDAFATHSWMVNVTGEPDSIFPATVDVTSLVTGQEPGELVVEWVAVGDDSLEGLPSAYLVRTSPTPITNEASWRTASDRFGVPPPAPAGTVQQAVVRDLSPRDFVHVTVRAIDDAGNLSPLGVSLSEWSKGVEVFGTIQDALTGLPAVGIEVSFVGQRDTTGVDGRYALTELPQLSSFFEVRDERTSSVGSYFDIRTVPIRISHNDVYDFSVIPNATLQTDKYRDLLEFVLLMTRSNFGSNSFLKTWDLPVEVYVPPLIQNGLDYEQVMLGALADWERLTGFDLFTVVPSIPAGGISVEYRSVTADNYRVTSLDENGLPLSARITMRIVYGPPTAGVMSRVARHEWGHSLGLDHSLDIAHILVGGVTPQVDFPTLDEIGLARVVIRIPPGFQMDQYLLD